jgi:hypothetical protein
MAERRVSVRLVAVGGRELKAELTGIGAEGQRALDAIATDGRGASQALTGVGASASGALAQMEALADRAARAAATLRAAGASTGTLVERIDRVTGVAPGLARSADDIAAYGSALDDLRAKHNPLFGVVRSYRASLADIRQAHAVGAISADEMGAAIGRERQAALASIAALKGRSTALTQMASASRYAAFQSRMLMFQLNDVFVSLVSGMNPMMVFVQQGAQIQQIYGAGQGGVQGALRDTGRMIGGVVTRFPLLTAAVVASSAAIAGMRHEINETSDVAVGFGDVALAVWQTIRDGLWNVLKPAVDAISPWFAAAWDAVVIGVRDVGNAIINGMRAAVEGVRVTVVAVPDIFLAAFNLAASHVATKLHDIAWWVGQMVDGIAGTMNEAFGTEFGSGGMGGVVDRLSEASGALYRAGMAAEGRADTAYADLRDRVARIMDDDPMGGFFDAVRDRAVANALDETAEAAGRAGGAMRKAGETAAKAMETAKASVDAVGDALAQYASDALDLGKGLGETLTGAFRGAEDAVAEFVKTGKLGLRDMVTSMIVDLARLSTRRFILGPISNALTGPLGGVFGGVGAAPALPSLQGGGHTGTAPRIGGLDGQGGFLAMLHPRERVVDETRRGGAVAHPVTVNIHTRDAQSFRQSRSQVAADIARAVAAGRRGL